jgi:predicted heme/steroid binding protein
MSKRFLSGINVTGSAALNTVADAGSNTDKFLVLDSSNVVSYRTASELYADLGIGSLPAGYTSTLKHEVKAGQAISKGQAVYVSSADGTNMIVTKASNVSEGTSSKTMGLLETSLSTNGKGNVITEGLLAGLNTNGATAGDPVWLGVDGALIFGLTNKPYAPAHLVFIGIVTRANANNGEIFVKVQNGFELKELHNYQEGSVQNNQVIVYESATSLYKPKSISTILGFTPSDDSLVVKLAGAQVITGAKSFDAAITVNAGIGFLNGVMPNITSNLYSGIGGNSQGISIVTRPVSTNYTNNLYFATSNNSFTFPNATGTIALTSDLTAYVPSSRTITINGTTYDLSANRSWTVSANQNARTEYEFTTNGSTATYTATYSVGQVDVFYNGSKLSSAEFTATNGTSVTLAFTPPTGQIVEVVAWETGGGISNSRTLTINGTAYDLSANRSWTIDNTSLGAQPQLNGTGFVKVSGTTVSYDNSTYLTTSSALSTYMPLSGGIFTGTTRMDGSGGTTPSITMIFNSGINRLLAPLLRLYGATNETSNYVELFGSLATQNRTIQLPDASGTIALTSNLSSYLPLTGGTLTGTLNGTSIYANGEITSTSHATFGTSNSTANVRIYSNGAPFTIFGGIGYARGFLGLTWDISPDRGIIIGNELRFNTNSIPGTTIGSTALTLASNQTATFASSVTLARPSSGATLLVLSGTSAYGDTSTLALCDGRSYIRSTIIAGTANGDTDIIFATQGSGVIAERVRINTDGQTRFQSSIILTNGQINSLGTGGGGQPMYLNFGGNGAIYAGSSYAVLYAGSDRRIKSDINDSESTLNKVLSLTPRTFRYKERPEFINYGFIAQEVEEVMPEIVKTSEGITICNGQEIVNQKSIESYGLAWASILVKAIQELTEKVNALENK